MRSPASTELLSSILLKRDKILGLIEGDACCRALHDSEQHMLSNAAALAMQAVELAENPDSIEVDGDLADVDECARLQLRHLESVRDNGTPP